LKHLQAFTSSEGQAAKTGTGGYSATQQDDRRIAELRASLRAKRRFLHATFKDLITVDDFRPNFLRSGEGDQEGFHWLSSMSAQQIESRSGFCA